MTEAVTQLDLTVFGPLPSPERLITQVVPFFVGGPTNPKRLVTEVNMQMLGTQPTSERNVTQVIYSILATRSPSYRFTDVILPDVFPYDISYNSVGSTRFATDVIVVDSGDDQRTQRWAQPLMEYDIAYGVRTMEQLQALIAFFRAMRGRLYAFNYSDVVDHSSAVALAIEARAAPAVTATDQNIGAGDGLTNVFQLTKTYTTPSGQANQVRTITRPNPSTVVVALNGKQVTNWTVDTTAGAVTFSSAVTLTFGHSVVKAAMGALNEATITGDPGDFTALAPYAGIGQGVVLSGFTNSTNNVPSTVMAALIAVSADGSTITVQYPGNYGVPAETTSGVTIATNPAPAPGVVVTAGFEFFVPVRFDTDTLPIQLEDYGIGGSNSIKLIEVRPSAF